jgi:uncharacterized membrane protein YeaQ/YmgE (transglycosylase-associated protein family)
MTPGELIILLIIAAIIGALGQALAGYTAGGCLISIVLGFIGALLGRWLAAQLGLPELFVISVGGVNLPLLWSIIGAALFVALLGLIRRPRV